MHISLLSNVHLTREPLGEGPYKAPDSKPSSLEEGSIHSHPDNDKYKFSVGTLSGALPLLRGASYSQGWATIHSKTWHSSKLRVGQRVSTAVARKSPTVLESLGGPLQCRT